MPCHVAIHGNEAVFLTSLPRRLKAVNLARLSPGFDTKDFVIKAKIVKRWPQQKTLLKLQLAQDDCVKRLNVFLKGTLSEECEVAEEGDVIAMSNVTVENNTRQTPDTVPCQVTADSDQASVWLLKTKKTKHLAVCDPQPSTSDAPGVAHVGRLDAATPLSGSSGVASGQSTAASRTSKAGRSKSSGVHSYTYTLLNDVQFGSVFNVFGVVKFFKEPMRTRGSDYRMVLSLVDASLEPGRKLKCLLFARDVSKLPDVRSVGDIVRLHRLKIKYYNDELQVQCSAGFSCLMFEGNVDGSLEPRTSDATFTLTDSDRDRVRELRDWVHSDVSPQKLSQEGDDTVTLSDVAVGQYFNLTCQIVATCVTEPGVCVLLRAWDGTKVNGPTYEEDTRVDELSERLTCDHPLVRRALGYIVDVFVFDDHFESASRIKPGDFVTFHNLHAMRHRNAGELVTMTTPDIIPSIEFCLHHGSSFGRRLLVLPPGSDYAETLKARLDAIVVNDSSRISDESGVLSGSWLMPLDVEGMDSASVVTCRENENCSEVKMEVEMSRQVAPSDVENKRASTPLRQGTSSEAAPNRSSTLGDARCMLITATVITGHHHVTPTKLIHVAGHTVPYKFRVSCKMVDFHPNVSTAEEFIQLFCPKCHFLSALVNGSSTQTIDATETRDEPAWLSKAEPSRVRGKVKYYACPQCHEKQDRLNRRTQGRRVELEYIYMLRFLLRDETCELPVVLWRSEAMKFFNQVEPASLLGDLREFLLIKSLLFKLCAHNLNYSSLECCIRTFTTPRGVTYEMFDTAICLDD